MNIIVSKLSKNSALSSAKKIMLKGVALAALSRVNIFGIYPFGLAFAATFSHEHAYIALIFMMLGMADKGIYSLKYILAFLIYHLLIYMKKTRDSMVKAIAVGVAVFIGGTVSFLWTKAGLIDLIMLSAEAVASGAVFYLFGFIGKKNDTAHFAELVTLGGIISGIFGISLPYININISAASAIFISMSIAYAFEVPIAGFAACVLGFMLNMQSESSVFYAGAFAISGMLSSALAAWGKIGAVTGFLSGIAVSVLYGGGFAEIMPIDIFLPIVLFAVIPDKWHMKLTELLSAGFYAKNEENSVTARVSGRLKTVAKAVCDLADGVTLLPDKTEKSSLIPESFDTVSSRVCTGCRLEGNCWGKDLKRTRENMESLLMTIERDGFCDYTNLPISFKQTCVRSESFLCEFKHSYELYKQNILYKGEAIIGRDIMAKQYEEISRAIDMLSHEVENGKECDQEFAKFSAQITVAHEAKVGQDVCGDTILHFEHQGKFFVILCDGMGSGNEAKTESGMTAKLFAQFLKAGFEKTTALNMINSALALKADRESFSTADILEIDLSCGKAEFLKIGSAQSFIKTKNNIDVISSKSLPIGILESIEVTADVRNVENGDIILMISDGVGEAGIGVLKNEWIKKMLSAYSESDELAKLVIAGAKAKSIYSDDMTCAVIRINKNRRERHEYT